MANDSELKKTDRRKRFDTIREFTCKNLVVVLENPKNLVNIGPAVRNVNALGAEKVYIVDGRKSLPEDWQEMRHWNPLVKSSASAIKWSFVKRFDNTDACLAHLEANNFKSIVTSSHVKGRKSVELSDGDYTTHKKLAVWFGNESEGVSDAAFERSEMCVSIPMFGIIESLNLGTSTGIVLYEITRQRRAYVAQNLKRGT